MLVLVWAPLLPYLHMPSTAALSKITLSNYGVLLADLGGWIIIQNTVLLTGTVSLLVMFFSFMVSWVVVRVRVRLYKVMDIIAMLPHAIPGLAFAFALAMLGILLSWWTPWFPFAGTLGIIVIANVVNRLSYGTRVINASLVQIQQELEECAQVCGAEKVTIMWRIIVPLIKPALVYASVWTALLTFREVSMALFLSVSHNRVLSVSIWNIWEGGELGVAAAGAVVMVGIMGVFVLVVLDLFGGVAVGQRRTGLASVRH